jgi:hypothetical protein
MASSMRDFPMMGRAHQPTRREGQVGLAGGGRRPDTGKELRLDGVTSKAWTTREGRVRENNKHAGASGLPRLPAEPQRIVRLLGRSLSA